MDVATFLKTHFSTDKNQNRRFALNKLLKHIGHQSDDITYAFDDFTTNQLIEACTILWPNTSTRVTNMGALKKALEKLTGREFDVTDVMKAGSKQVALQRGENKPTEKMLKNPEVTWEALQQLELRLRKSEYASPQHALLAFRVLAWPRRNEDLQQVRVSWSLSDTDNVLFPGTPMVVRYNKHKTVAKHGPFVLKFDDKPELEAIMREYVRNKQEGDVLFPDVVGIWDTVMVKHFGARNFGIRELRRLAAEYVNKQRFNANQKQYIAEHMGHTITQNAYYDVVRANNAELHRDDSSTTEEPQLPPLDDAEYALEILNVCRDYINAGDMESVIFLLRNA